MTINNRSIFSSEENLKRFLYANDDIAKIKKASSKKKYSKYDGNSFDLVKKKLSIFSYLSAFFKKIFKNTHFTVPFLDSKKVKLLVPMNNNVNYKTLKQFQEKYYSKEETFNSKVLAYFRNKEIDFKQRKGSCKGICSFFIHLEKCTEKLFNSKEAQLIKIAKRFLNELPFQALVLQELKHLSYKENFSLEMQINSFDKQKQEFLKILKNLSDGSYKISAKTFYKNDTPNISHALVLVKSKKNIFLLDPNFGLFKLSSAEDVYNFFKLYSQTTKNTNSEISISKIESTTF